MVDIQRYTSYSVRERLRMPRIKNFKKLYRYSYKTLDKHNISDNCHIYYECDHGFGELWRCKHNFNEFFGYARVREAKLEEISNAIEEISKLNKWLKKLRGIR